jgi:hypothetical protein
MPGIHNIDTHEKNQRFRTRKLFHLGEEDKAIHLRRVVCWERDERTVHVSSR